MTRLSPSTIVTKRLGAPRRDAIAEAAIGSVGDRTAPSTNAGAQGSPATSWATTATPADVATTRPMASERIGRALSRISRSELKKAAW